VRIEILAERTGVPPKTIRYYEEIALMPRPARTPSGYRDYEESAERRLAFIRAAQSVDLTLGEIQEVLAFRDRGELPCRHVTALIEQHAQELSARILALESMRNDLQDLVRRAREVSESQAEKADYCHIIELRARR
jgi:MerR family copper efflux transcriptional regulator